MKIIHDPFAPDIGQQGFKENQITRYGGNREVSDTFLIGDSPDIWLGKIVSQKKFVYFLFFLILVFLILLSRLFFLQFVRGESFHTLAEGNRLKLEKILPPRGIFFDSFGRPLVDNIPTFTLFLNKSELKNHLEKIAEVTAFFKTLSLADEQIDLLLNSPSYLPVAVLENLTYDQALEYMVAIKDNNILSVEVDQQRSYVNIGLAHLLGYTSRIGQAEKNEYLKKGYQLTEKIGRSALEEYYQKWLRGQPGKKEVEVDSLGRETKVVAEQPAIGGDSVFLGLDLGLQQVMYETLQKYLPHKAGALVAMDPNNGYIRGYLSWPTFDTNNFSRGISTADYQALVDNPLKPLFNRIIAGEYPSGSTIKMIIGLAGLEEGLITRQSTVNSLGGVWYDKWFFPDWRVGGHGLTNIIKALADSVNTFFYYLALEDFDGHHGLGLEKMTAYLKKFGLGKSLGIDQNGERGGFVPSREWKEAAKGEAWYPGDTLHLAIGQGDILVTPLQVAAYTSAIANGGILYKPKLVEKIVETKSGLVTTMAAEVLDKNLADPKNLAIIMEGLRSSVTSGSSRGIYGVNMEVAGKTGTAQPNATQLPHAWFTGFFPYQQPRLVLTVLVENGGESTDLAVPIAREIIQWYDKNRP